MATTTTHPPEFVQPPARDSGRTAGTVIASVGGVFAGMLALAGVALILVHAGARDDDGFYTTGDERLSTSAYALTSETINAELDDAVLIGEVGTLRVSVEGEKPVFVGIARQGNVDAYLGGVAHDQVGGDFPDGSPEYSRVRGGAPATPPAQEDIWIASSQGAGRQTVDWEIRDGSYAAVVMNADGSRAVAVDAEAGVKLDWLQAVGIALAGVGLVGATVAGVGVFALNRRR